MFQKLCADSVLGPVAKTASTSFLQPKLPHWRLFDRDRGEWLVTAAVECHCYHQRVENHGLKWWQVRWGLAGRKISRAAIVTAKVIGLLCLVAGIGYGVAYLISPWLASRGLSRFDSRVDIVPVSLSNKAEAPLSNLSIDLYGFRLLLPNNEVGEVLKGEQTTTMRLRNGVLIIRNSSHDENWIVSELAHGNEFGKKLLAPDLLDSRYSLMEATMFATPDQVKWWRFRTKENQRIAFLLMTKLTALTQVNSMRSATVRSLYRIEFGDFRGFQFGNPDAAPYDIHVDVFNGANRHFQFDIFGLEGHGPVLTQPEVNAMVGSIRQIQPQVSPHIENIEER